jgi:hypothetical protein
VCLCMCRPSVAVCSSQNEGIYSND